MGTVWSLVNPWQHWAHEAEMAQSVYQIYAESVVEAVRVGNIDALKKLQVEGREDYSIGVEFVAGAEHLLCLAASFGWGHIVEYLLELEVNPDETDGVGMTALHHACRCQRVACVQVLLGKVREVDRRDVWGRTPLIKALVHRCTDAAKMLLEAGANPNVADIYGMTPITTVIDYNLTDFLESLVNHGADVNQMTHYSSRWSGPPLYLAINNQNAEMVEALLRMGATTVPRPQNYSQVRHGGSMSWSYFNGGNYYPIPTPSLLHPNAVAMAMGELMKRGDQVDAQCQGMKVLMVLLAAHGDPLGPSPDVLVRVLINSRPDDFSILLYKLHICSTNCQDGMLGQPDRDMNAQSSQQLHLRQMDHHLHNNNTISEQAGGDPQRISLGQVTSLENQARRVVRRAVMCSGRNVLWATQRLECPPALKSLVLLKDVDRAYHPLEIYKPFQS